MQIALTDGESCGNRSFQVLRLLQLKHNAAVMVIFPLLLRAQLLSIQKIEQQITEEQHISFKRVCLCCTCVTIARCY